MLLAALTAAPACSRPAGVELLPVPYTPSDARTAPADAASLQAEVIVSGLRHPWSMSWLPDGALLISERDGALKLFRHGQATPELVSGVPEVFASGQGGLLEVAVHPQFERNGWIYLTYAAGDTERNRTTLARARLEGTRLIEPEVLYAVPQWKRGSQHFGSRLLWLEDGTLLMSVGDGGNPPLTLDGALIREQAQNQGSALGKLLRLRDDGSIPADNPLVGDAGAEPTVWSLGHRNIQGLARDAGAGAIWASEHGALGGDELNRVGPGGNHGWPLVTHSREYSGAEITPRRSAPGLQDPQHVWTPAIAPSGLAVHGGGMTRAWRGDLFAGGLVSRDVRHLRRLSDGSVVELGALRIGQRVRDVREGPDGCLYVLTDSGHDGRLLRLVAGGDVAGEADQETATEARCQASNSAGKSGLET
ncbi:PQQ-dependent sugar dehydrogenase [Synechococcus sp. RSCCF101]|nr:PQQ-dependent sugar dehydrogenase [Synechococcus sp. RSCCF101]